MFAFKISTLYNICMLHSRVILFILRFKGLLLVILINFINWLDQLLHGITGFYALTVTYISNVFKEHATLQPDLTKCAQLSFCAKFVYTKDYVKFIFSK